MAEMNGMHAYYASLFRQVNGHIKDESEEHDYRHWPDMEIPEYCKLCIRDFPKDTLVPTDVNGSLLDLCPRCIKALGLGKES